MDDGRGRVSAGNKRSRGDEGRAAEPPPAGRDGVASDPVSAEQMQRELAALRQEMRTQRAESNVCFTHLEEELRSQAAQARRLQEEANNFRWVIARAVPNSAMHLPKPTLAWADSPMAALPAGVMANIMDSLGPCAKQRISAGLVCKAFKEACSGPATVYRFGEYKELGHVFDTASSPAGGVFACACTPADDDARSLRILALDSGREIRRMEFPGNVDDEEVGRFEFNHNGSQILVDVLSTLHSRTEIRRVDDGSLLATIEGGLYTASFAGASSEFVTATLKDDESMFFGKWSSSTGQLLQRIRVDLPGHGPDCWWFSVKPTGREFVACKQGFPNQSALVYNVGVDTVVEAWRLPAALETTFDSCSWSPDESRLFSCSSLCYDENDRQDLIRFQLWDAADGREIWRSDIKWRFRAFGFDASWSPNGRKIYVPCADTEDADDKDPPGGVIVVDALTGEVRRLNCGLMPEIGRVACTADSRALMTLTKGALHVWDLGAETTAVNRL